MLAETPLPRRIGDRAEALAARFLQAQGLQLIARNYVRRIGEIDLILRDPTSGSIVFVEVRYRHRTTRYGDGIDSIGLAKQRKLRRTANAWLQMYADSTTPARIDVLAIQRSQEESGSPYPAATNRSVSYDGYRLTWIVNAL